MVDTERDSGKGWGFYDFDPKHGYFQALKGVWFCLQEFS